VAEHRTNGVDVKLGVQVVGLEGSAAVQAVRLSSGERIACDAVVYGLGVQPCTDLARSAGLEIDNGIRTNAFLQTKEEYIFACGDVCCYDSHRYGRPIRLENWRNAEDQADTVARNILGQSNIYDEVPWFWSNQFDFALQVAGLPAEGTVTETQAIGNAQLFLSYSVDGALCGASALGPMRDVAGSIRNYRAQLAVGAGEYILSNTIAQ
jgi:3-phenylpropionate/trans-cinnamate dioxygenase ferredoxin reductase subunit